MEITYRRAVSESGCMEVRWQMRQQQFFSEHEKQIMVAFACSTIEGTIVPGAGYMVEGIAQPHQAAENRHRPILELHTPATCTA